MLINVGWLPSFGVWTSAVHEVVVTAMVLVGLMGVAGLLVRSYRYSLQAAAWMRKK